MNKMVLPAAAFVALMFCLLAAPAAAAKITYQVSGHNITSGPFDPGPTCGVDGPNTIMYTDTYSTTVWDNGRYLIHWVTVGDIFDSTGNLIAHGQTTIHEQGYGYEEGDGRLPHTYEINMQFQCTGKSLTPGDSWLYHFGATMGADGIEREHFVSKP